MVLFHNECVTHPHVLVDAFSVLGNKHFPLIFEINSVDERESWNNLQ